MVSSSLVLLASIHPSAWKRNSPKFAVTSERRFGLQGCRSLRTLSLLARIEGKFVEFVPRDCYEQWRLATLQLPENFSKERHLSRAKDRHFPARVPY